MHFRENWLIFLGIWGEDEFILGIWGAKENIFRELRYFFIGIWGDQCIIFRDLGSTDPPWGASKLEISKSSDQTVRHLEKQDSFKCPFKPDFSK